MGKIGPLKGQGFAATPPPEVSGQEEAEGSRRMCLRRAGLVSGLPTHRSATDVQVDCRAEGGRVSAALLSQANPFS